MTQTPASRRVAGADPRRAADLARAHRAVERLEAGTTWFNAHDLTPVEAHFDGVEGCGSGRGGFERRSGVKSVHAGSGEAPF